MSEAAPSEEGGEEVKIEAEAIAVVEAPPPPPVSKPKVMIPVTERTPEQTQFYLEKHRIGPLFDV